MENQDCYCKPASQMLIWYNLESRPLFHPIQYFIFRLAEVWMDDYKKYYYERIGQDLVGHSQNSKDFDL